MVNAKSEVDRQTACLREPNYQWRQAPDALKVASTLADELASGIQLALDQRDHAFIALSGGSTPKPMFEALVSRDVDWSRVTITLVDERWVPETHPLSNAAFLRTHLLASLPVTAHFLPLFSQADNPQITIAELEKQIDNLPFDPIFDAVVLGMGEDGHTASFFPDAPNITELMSTTTDARLLSCESPSTQVPRITWSLPMLLNTRYLALHFTGASKRQVFEAALGGPDAVELPIRAAVFQRQHTLQVFYADG